MAPGSGGVSQTLFYLAFATRPGEDNRTKKKPVFPVMLYHTALHCTGCPVLAEKTCIRYYTQYHTLYRGEAL